MPVLQVALDLMQLNRSIVIAHEAVDGGADWIEAGTPLIKSEGAEAVRALRREFPGKKIIADTKTMDVGSFEVEIMAKAGADIVTVLGLADDATIEEAVMAGRKYGAEIMIDMINVPDRVQRAKEVEKLGAAYICMHMGIDTQMRGEEPPIDVLRKIVDAVSIPVAVAGGITAENAGEYVEAGATDVIVGGAIIKTEDIRGAAENIKKAMSGAKIDTNLAKKYSEEDLFEAFSRVSTCNISDAFHKQGVMFGIVPQSLKHRQKMVGRALTVQTTNGDWAKPVEAIDRADMILLGPGSLYTSVIPNLLVEGVADAVARSRALKVYVGNVMTQEGETEGYTAADHIRAIFQHSVPGLFQLCLVNSAPIPREMQEKYEEEGAEPLVCDEAECGKLGVELVYRPVSQVTDRYVRHDPALLARALIELHSERSVRLAGGGYRIEN